VAVSFSWQVLGITPATVIEVEFAKGYRKRLVRGLYDSGADYAHLRKEWQSRLRVADEECTPWQDRVADGHIVDGLLTFLDATLDGHTFRMPVVFSEVVPTDLFGRAGIADQFKIENDPSQGMSTFTWTGAKGEPWAAKSEAVWKEAVSKTKKS
jgi:hypothetical protein